MEISFPIEEQPLPGAQWSAVTKGIGNGILDEGGFPYRLVFKSDANATNQGVLKCPTIEGQAYGQAILDGFYHKYTEDIVLDFPAVTRSTRYYVVLEIVPTRATEGQLPVQAKVVTSLDYSQDKNYLHLYNVDREPNQLLTDAKVRMIRPRVAPVMVYASESDMPRADKSLWGTLAVVHGGRASTRTKIFMAMNEDASGQDSEAAWFWKLIYDQSVPTWEPFTLFSQVKWAGHGQQPRILRDGKRRELRGRLSRTSGGNFGAGSSATGEPYFLATIPAADRPSAGTVSGFGQVSGSNPPGFTRLELSAGTGELRSAASKETVWVGLDGFSWWVD